MFAKLLSFFRSNPQEVKREKVIKSIAFLDGDQDLKSMVAAHSMYLKGIETHLVRVQDPKNNEPKVLRKVIGINKIYLVPEYKTGKEIVDKFIGAYIQKSVSEGYNHITVVSSDYDFIDIFKMALVLNPDIADDVTFRIIVPHPMGTLKRCPPKLRNIEVVRMK